MAVPTITNVSPSEGSSMGATNVRILGLRFAENVRVTFDGIAAPRVVRVNSSLLYATSPEPALDPVTGVSPDPVDVAVQNLDSNGDDVVGEVDTLAASFSYLMPKLTGKQWLTQVTERMILALRRGVITEVVLNQHSDYSDQTAIDGLDETQLTEEAVRVRLTKLPSLVLLGPELIENRVRQLFDVEQVASADITGSAFRDRLASFKADLEFEVIGVAESTVVLLNLMNVLVDWFSKNRVLRVPCDPSDPTGGSIPYDLEWIDGGFPGVRGPMNDSNVVSFSGTFRITGVDTVRTDESIEEGVIDAGGVVSEDGIDLCANLTIEQKT